jgi:hypothetical protein
MKMRYCKIIGVVNNLLTFQYCICCGIHFVALSVSSHIPKVHNVHTLQWLSSSAYVTFQHFLRTPRTGTKLDRNIT